jgi:hypothetical protein
MPVISARQETEVGRLPRLVLGKKNETLPEK